MKIAIAGKGGVGKTTITALLAVILNKAGKKIILIDADPDMNLAGILGIPEDLKITPIIELKEIIAQRTGTNNNLSSGFFRLNPKVDDILKDYCIEYNGIKMLTMGTVSRGGSGCSCPENAFLKALISHLLIARDEYIILDMEAGIEHLGRGTAMGVDELVIIVEPGLSSINTALRIRKLSNDIGIKKIRVICNMIRNKSDKEYLEKNLKDFNVLGYISYSDEIKRINTGLSNASDIKGLVLDQLNELILKAGFIHG